MFLEFNKNEKDEQITDLININYIALIRVYHYPRKIWPPKDDYQQIDDECWKILIYLAFNDEDSDNIVREVFYSKDDYDLFLAKIKKEWGSKWQMIR